MKKIIDLTCVSVYIYIYIFMPDVELYFMVKT